MEYIVLGFFFVMGIGFLIMAFLMGTITPNNRKRFKKAKKTKSGKTHAKRDSYYSGHTPSPHMFPPLDVPEPPESQQSLSTERVPRKKICQKCGNFIDQPNMLYSPYFSTQVCDLNESIDGEHIHVECNNCFYVWAEPIVG